jgi:hypothetical protein
MRKNKSTPRLSGGLPEELDLLVQCKLFLQFPDEYDSSDFAKKLAQWIVANVRLPKQMGREIAAMVDALSVNRLTISAAKKDVADLLGDRFSVEAIDKCHNRYGKTVGQIRSTKAELDEQIKRIESKMTDVDKASLSRLSEDVQRILMPHYARISRFGEARKDIIAKTVLEDD